MVSLPVFPSGLSPSPSIGPRGRSSYVGITMGLVHSAGVSRASPRPEAIEMQEVRRSSPLPSSASSAPPLTPLRTPSRNKTNEKMNSKRKKKKYGFGPPPLPGVRVLFCTRKRKNVNLFSARSKGKEKEKRKKKKNCLAYSQVGSHHLFPVVPSSRTHGRGKNTVLSMFSAPS